VIHIPEHIESKISFLVGSSKQVSNIPTTVLNQSRIDFLSHLSSVLLKNTVVRELPDVISFAFWCRKSNLKKISTRMDDNQLRIGLGLVFHISPANVPVNFAFSLVFSLLAGNSSVVRLPSHKSESASAIISAILTLLEKPQYMHLGSFIHLIKYDRDDEINQFWALAADGKVVWGGDKTVEYMRSLNGKPRSREVSFPDRYSICAMNPEVIIDLSNKELDVLCVNLFNDIYVMDQNACSSPQLFIWVGNKKSVEIARNKLWARSNNYANKKYKLEPIHAMDKYVDICRNILMNNNIENIELNNNITYNIELNKLHKQQQSQRGYFGTIHEITVDSLDVIAEVVDENCQTLAYYGFEKNYLYEFVVNNHLRGIDRVIPVGKSLEMDVIWDGYNVIESLSRIVDIQ